MSSPKYEYGKLTMNVPSYLYASTSTTSRSSWEFSTSKTFITFEYNQSVISIFDRLGLDGWKLCSADGRVYWFCRELVE